MIDEVKKVFFIINKYSGTGRKTDFEGEIMMACQANGVACGMACTEGPAHATALAAEALGNGFELIVAVGGDGTLNEVALGLLNTSGIMGIIPKGSGNGLARHLGIPLRLDLALKCLFTSQVIAMDTFRVNGRPSLNVSGIGFDGYIADLFGMEKTRGLRGYTRLVLNEFMNFPEFDARLIQGEKEMVRKAFVIAIANSSQYGNNARIAPAASIRDGLLNISILKKIPPYRLDFIYSFFSGTIDQSAYCENLKVRDVSIQLNTPISYHIDGEPAGKADAFKIELMPASLSILAPRECGKV